jgi:hypothetical protein
MIPITAALIFLLALGVFLAARALAGFEPEPEWRDVGKLRERLSSELPEAPAFRTAQRRSTVRFCLSLRREFVSALRLCRFLAPISGDAGYVGSLLMSNVKFHGLLGLALVCAAAGREAWCDRLMGRLRRLSGAMRRSALVILTSPDLEHGFMAA